MRLNYKLPPHPHNKAGAARGYVPFLGTTHDMTTLRANTYSHQLTPPIPSQRLAVPSVAIGSELVPSPVRYGDGAEDEECEEADRPETPDRRSSHDQTTKTRLG